ncbi:MAG: DUF6314 family protein [Bacteroidota bacterium]
MRDAADVLARLGAATRATVEVRAGQGAGGTGAGTATVTVDGDTVVIAEAGTWATAASGPMRWRAVSRWQAEGEALAVEHVRQGEPARAVLDRQADGTWRARAPYLCGQDRYEAALDAGPEAVAMTWTISGPCKAARIVTRYTSEAENPGRRA